MNEESLELETSLTLRSSLAGEVVMKEIALGSAPMVFIDVAVPDEENEDKMVLKVDATDFESTEDLADFFELLTTILREGEKAV